VDTWQLVINTATTIVTFLIVALLQNSQHRAEQAIHQKLDALADGLADFMEHLGGDQPGFANDIDDLRRAVGSRRRWWTSTLQALAGELSVVDVAPYQIDTPRRIRLDRRVRRRYWYIGCRPPFGGAAGTGRIRPLHQGGI
jgi:hypothetical protein